MPAIASITTTLQRFTMPRPWVPEAPWLHLVRVDVVDDEGATGSGFTWTPTIGATAVRALLDDDITSAALGSSTEPEILWPQLWAHLHEAGGGGITTIALAGLDTALWDLRGRRAGLGLAELLGRRRETVRAYGSGVNLHLDADALAAQVGRWIAAGHDAVKVKVGKPDVAEDLDRLTMARELLGPNRRLMIDANQRWDLERATSALERLSVVDPAWIEEPLRSDDTAGYERLHQATDIPIALGENVHTIHRFRDLVDRGVADVLQPNVVRVGGITPFLRIAELVEDAGLILAPHLLPDLSGQLALALPQTVEIEDVEDADFVAIGAIDAPGPVTISRGWARVEARPGLGFVIREHPTEADTAR
ncbi:racemase [Plantibacter sp. Leaf171]|uniref:mandelate racemase/muconate lactonizing enzyme family protein n=1 Tax=unclassified Plantibacter TaxID=2624265 RepID=UPI0006FE571B|nr:MULTISPECIES: mandelate racemase/muconate lactonizing enzyme family protein [unclassified Plantibacter]KQM17696.1 racemase [Plantibacter sp. Leaf1]KQQ49655.1 racemase [Plantibacter sp. Leaf314]KQR60478.1 racemase [Plantibacter sp. Leaf171]